MKAAPGVTGTEKQVGQILGDKCSRTWLQDVATSLQKKSQPKFLMEEAQLKNLIILEWKFWKMMTTFPILFSLFISTFRNTLRKEFGLYTTAHGMQNRANKMYDNV